MAKFISSSSTKQAKTDKTTLPLIENAEGIELISNSSDKPESILSQGKTRQSQHVTSCDDIMNVKIEPEVLPKQVSNTNLSNIGPMVSPKVLGQKVFGKLKQVKVTVEKINTNNNTKDTNKPNYCKSKRETRKRLNYFSFANVSWKRSLKVSMQSLFSIRSFIFPQNPNTGLIPRQNVDPMKTASVCMNTNDYLEQNNDNTTRQCDSIAWQHSNKSRQQKVKDWLKSQTERLEYNPIDTSANESNINTPMGDISDAINDTSNNLSVFFDLSSMTESTSSRCTTGYLADDSSEDLQNNFNNSRRTEVLVKKDSLQNTKNSKPTISEICMKKCYQLNKNYRIWIKE